MPADGACLVQLVVRVPCEKQVHPHSRPHTAHGCTDGGVYWSVTWWSQKLVLDDPDSPANTDPSVTVYVGPRPAVRCRVKKVRRERRVGVNSVNEPPIVRA